MSLDAWTYHVHHVDMAPSRPNQFKMLLSDEELETLRELAERAGLSASDYLRQLIRREHEEQRARSKGKATRGAVAKEIAALLAEAKKP